MVISEKVRSESDQLKRQDNFLLVFEMSCVLLDQCGFIRNLWSSRAVCACISAYCTRDCKYDCRSHYSLVLLSTWMIFPSYSGNERVKTKRILLITLLSGVHDSKRTPIIVNRIEETMTVWQVLSFCHPLPYLLSLCCIWFIETLSSGSEEETYTSSFFQLPDRGIIRHLSYSVSVLC